MSKSVLVTGASRGIGRAIAERFAREGYLVFINCRKSIDDLSEVSSYINNETKGSAFMVPGNVGDPQDVKGIFEKIYSQVDVLDVLVNNAGVSIIGLMQDMTDDEWDQVVSTNLSSVFYCCRQAVPPMVTRKSGSIINISSMWGLCGASCECGYSAAKAGVNGLTKALAKELAPSGISVNAVAAGVVDTVMNGELCGDERRQLCEEIPAGRFAETWEVADLVWQMANSSKYMTGQVIAIDGGFL